MATKSIQPPIKLSRETEDWVSLIREWLDRSTESGGATIEWDVSQTLDPYIDLTHDEEFSSTVSCHDGSYVEFRMSIDVGNLIVFLVFSQRCTEHMAGGCHGRVEEVRIDCERGAYYELHLLTEFLNWGLAGAGLEQRFTVGKMEWQGYDDRTQ